MAANGEGGELHLPDQGRGIGSAALEEVGVAVNASPPKAPKHQHRVLQGAVHGVL